MLAWEMQAKRFAPASNRKWNMKDHASRGFRRPPERLNCAQAVRHARTSVYGEEVMPVSDLKPFGGGRAPGGLCGALYAPCILAPQKAESLMSRFAQELGSTRCEELRTNKKHPCEGCVAMGARLVQSEVGGCESGAA